MEAIYNKILRTLLIAGLLFVLQPCNRLFSQQFEYFGEQPVEQPGIPIIYFGFGLGVNEYGLGLNVEVPFTHHFSLNGNAGLGGWGWKFGGSLNIYPYKVTEKHEFSIGYAVASGLQDFDTELPIEPNGEEYMVNLDLNKVHTLNLIYTYNIKAGRSCKAALSLGYAICLTQDPYDVNSSVTLDQTSEQVLRIMQPGGLILGFKFMIGAM
jgi:hypothetical protein